MRERLDPAVEHRFGPYGGQYVPETLMPALAELEQGWLAAREDPAFREALAGLLRDYAGRPTPLYRARRLSETVGAPVYLKREDLLHTGRAQAQQRARPGAARAPHGQDAHDRRDRRRPARRRHRHRVRAAGHRVPASTWAPRTCAASSPTSSAWGCSAPPSCPSTPARARSRRRRRAAIRDWVANVGTTHYVIGSAVGPAPYPALVRDLQRVIGDEARAQLLEQAERLPDRVIACVGGGSNAIGIFAAFLDDDQVELVGVEAAGEGIETGRHGAPLTVGGRAGVLHGAFSAVLQDDDGQILEAHSISAGLDYPGTGPQHAWLRDTGRARYVAVTDDEALGAFRAMARLEGIIPALETAHALAWVLANPPATPTRWSSSASPGAATRTSPRSWPPR